MWRAQCDRAAAAPLLAAPVGLDDPLDLPRPRAEDRLQLRHEAGAALGAAQGAVLAILVAAHEADHDALARVLGRVLEEHPGGAVGRERRSGQPVVAPERAVVDDGDLRERAVAHRLVEPAALLG